MFVVSLVILEKAIHALGNFSSIFFTNFFALFNRSKKSSKNEEDEKTVIRISL